MESCTIVDYSVAFTIFMIGLGISLIPIGILLDWLRKNNEKHK